MSDDRTPKEKKLSEIKLEKEIEKLDLEQARLGLAIEGSQLEVAEMHRDERDALAHNSEARRYNFLGGVEERSVDAAIKTLDEWARISKERITVIFNSPGGSVFNGLALYDAIQAIKAEGVPVTTVVRGMAASMAGILLQAGDERIIGENAYILIHEVSSVHIGNASELDDQLKLTKRLQARCLDILAKRSTFTTSQIERKWKKTDWWLDATESCEFGFADKVG